MRPYCKLQSSYFHPIKHCRRHNVPKALRTLTSSTPSVQSRSSNKLWNLWHPSAWYDSPTVKGMRPYCKLQRSYFHPIKHCRRHNVPKALRTLTSSNLWHPSAWFCLAKGKKFLCQFWQIHVPILTNPSINFDKSIKQLREIHVTTLTNPIWTKFNKSSDWGVTHWQGKAMIGLRSDKKNLFDSRLFSNVASVSGSISLKILVQFELVYGWQRAKKSI